jgi:hypothetical protein
MRGGRVTGWSGAILARTDRQERIKKARQAQPRQELHRKAEKARNRANLYSQEELDYAAARAKFIASLLKVE